MTLVLKTDEKMEKQLEIDSRFDKAIMYVTTKAIILEHQKKGIFFERLHTQIASMEATAHNKIKVKWPEERQLFDFEFKTKDAPIIVKEIVERHNYDENFPDLMGVNSVILFEKEQKEIVEKRIEGVEKNIDFWKKLLDEANLELNMIASDDPDKTEKILEASDKAKQLHDHHEMLVKYKEDIPNIVINRSKKIPKEIPNHRCWNDCWYDEETKCFVTLNESWNIEWVREYLKENELVKKFNVKNIIPNAYAIPYDVIKYDNGYPVYQYTHKENEMLTAFLPTMTDEMLNDEMISKKHGWDIETVGDRLPVKIRKTVEYNTSTGSKLILKNGDKFAFTRKETIFLLNRRMIAEKDIPLLP